MPAPRQLRLFGRIRRGGLDFECPGCGRVYLLRADSTRALFKEEAQMFRCTSIDCNRAYLMGLVFYNVRPGTVRERIPEDAVPTVDQAGELTKLEAARVLRGAAVSYLQQGGKRPSSPVKGAGPAGNVGPGCTCGANWRGEAHSGKLQPDCPRHGGGGGESPPD
jgi:predicted RNA-binding Zn-ribbon protein involved in translation (DUF1610 family)